MGNDYEKDLALMEASCYHSMNEFFKHRQWFHRTSGTHNCTERLFEHAFKRGWDAKTKDIENDKR